MDFLAGPAPVNDFEVRGRTSSSNKIFSRDASMFLTRSSIIYHERMTKKNEMDVDSEPEDISPALSYEMEQEKALQVSKVTEQTGNMRSQDEKNEATIHNPKCVNNVNQCKCPLCGAASQDDNNDVINIQLPYDPNAPTEPDLWSSNFHPISLYGSIKYIASDSKSIKDSLNFIAKYIVNKKVNSSNANDLSDFDGMDGSIWNFIYLVYQAN